MIRAIHAAVQDIACDFEVQGIDGGLSFTLGAEEIDGV